jgi:hypothetical protein
MDCAVKSAQRQGRPNVSARAPPALVEEALDAVRSILA